MNDLYAERIAKALESIAESLAKLARPPMMMMPSGEVAVLAPEMFAVAPGTWSKPIDLGQPVRIVPIEGKVS